jgi:hypothetical protein
MLSRVSRALLTALVVLTFPVAARAVTLDDIVALSRAGVSAEILIAVIDADRTIFSLTREEIVVLTKAGVPSAVVLKMLGTAREFVEEVPPPLIVGADRPGAAETSDRPGAFETSAIPSFPVGPYFAVPYPIFGVPGIPVAPGISTGDATFGRFINKRGIGQGFSRFMNYRGLEPLPPPPPPVAAK